MDYDLIVVTQEPFPYGLAATNRMLSYLKGVAQDHSVLFLTYAGPAYGQVVNKQQCGIYDNINFRYTGKTYKKSKPYFLERKTMFLCRLFKLYFLLLFYYHTKSLLLYSTDENLIKTCKFISKIKGCRLYRDVTETKGAKHTRESEQSLKKLCTCLDGLIVISQGIWDFFDTIPDEKKYLLPVLIDPDRFINTNIVRQKYFFCCSGANLERDGLLDILTGFLEFWKNHTDYTLQIASKINTNDDYHLKCKEIIDNNQDSIIYLGELPAYDIPLKMMEASALLLTPHHEYATKGFPTKLGEYLMSGTPTICSTIDDLTSVLPKEVVLWVSPNAPDEISHQLSTISENPAISQHIGNTGRDWMKNNYTYHKYLTSLNMFLEIDRNE